MPVVVSIIVGGVLAVWLAIFLWSLVRAAGGSRLRAGLRSPASVPEGLEVGIKEPEALRAAFAFILRGDVRDVAQSMTGTFRGDAVGITDLTVAHGEGGAPTNHTVATLDVDWRWPWMRLRRVDVQAPAVQQPTVDITDLVGADDWILEASNPELAKRLVTTELLAWLRRGDLPLQVETTPRHLLVAHQGHLEDARLGELLDLTTGVVDHVPSDVRAEVTAPRPEDDL